MFDVEYVFKQEVDALLTIEFLKRGKSRRVLGVGIVVVAET